MKEILLTSTVLILVMVIARLVFRGKVSHRFLYGAWLLVAIRLLVPIQFGQFDFSVLNQAEPVAEVITEVSRSPISGPSRQEIYQQVSRDYSDLGYNIETPEIQVQIEETVTESITAPTVGEIATTVWIVGMVGMALWFFLVNFLYARKLRRSSSIVEEGHIPVRVSGAISSPCLFGLFRPVIYLTPTCAGNEQMRRHTANTSKAICLQLYNSGTLTDAETDVVKQMLEQISPSDYGNIVYKEKLITELKGRTLIPASEYSYKITCMEVYDPVGYAGQYWFGSLSTESRGSGGYSDVYLEIYNPYYTDAQCPESNHDVSCQYDEAFYENHILLVLNVHTQKGILPNVNRIYTGEENPELSELGTFNVYIDNVVENPTERAMYTIWIELPRSYWDGETDWFPVYDNALYYDMYWFWKDN